MKRYRLSPFLVGWYESYLQESKPTSPEFARIYEQYVIEGGGEKIFCPRPGPQGVIPYRGSLKPEWLEREPHNDIDAHFQRHDRFLVIDCVCKKEKVAAHGHSCGLPNKRCGFVGMPPAVPLSENVISREEAIKLWNELDAMGTMVVEGFYGFTMGAEAPQFVGGCHCCGCCCSILNAARLAPLAETIQRSNYRVVKDYETCASCGECVRRCQFFAHTFDKATDEQPVYHRDRCVGCGACGMGCPTGSLHLEPVSEEEWFHVPSSFQEWEERRLEHGRRDIAWGAGPQRGEAPSGFRDVARDVLKSRHSWTRLIVSRHLRTAGGRAGGAAARLRPDPVRGRDQADQEGVHGRGGLARRPTDAHPRDGGPDRGAGRPRRGGRHRAAREPDSQAPGRLDSPGIVGSGAAFRRRR